MMRTRNIAGAVCAMGGVVGALLAVWGGKDSNTQETESLVAAADSIATPFSRCRNQAPFFVQLYTGTIHIILDGNTVKNHPPPSRRVLYKTDLASVAGTIEVCAVPRPKPTSPLSLTIGTDASVEIALEGSDSLTIVPLNSCAVFTGHLIEMLSSSNSNSWSRARVCLIESIGLK